MVKRRDSGSEASQADQLSNDLLSSTENDQTRSNRPQNRVAAPRKPPPIRKKKKKEYNFFRTRADCNTELDACFTIEQDSWIYTHRATDFQSPPHFLRNVPLATIQARKNELSRVKPSQMRKL